MFIGSQSTSTILDVFETGMQATIREAGLPAELSFTSDGCKIFAKGFGPV